MNVLAWIARLLLPSVGSIADRLDRAYRARLAAQTDKDRISAEVTVAALEAEIRAAAEAAHVRRSMAGFWEMRLLTFVAGFPPALHFGAVCIASLFEDPPIVHRLPAPMDEWQGAIILSLFGLSAVGTAARVAARWRPGNR